LLGILENVDDLSGGSLQIEVSAVGEQVNVGVATDDIGETFAEFAVQETHDLSYPLQREAFAAELADNDNFGEILHGVEAAMALAPGLDHATFVPPLELAGGDAGEGDDFLRWKALPHNLPAMFQTIYSLNV
jgi:hypothetical protein